MTREVDLTAHAVTYAKLLAAKARETEAKTAAVELRAELEAALGDGPAVGLIGGVPAVERTTSKRTALSQQLLKRLHPEVAAECMEVTEVSRFTIRGGS